MKNYTETALIRIHKAFEAIVLLVVMFGALTWVNANPRPVSFEQVLQMNVRMQHVLIALMSAAIWSGVLGIAGAYERHRYQSVWRTGLTMFVATAITMLIVLVSLAALAPPLAHYKWLSTVFGLTLLGCLLVRLTAALLSSAAPATEKRVLIVGAGAGARKLHERLRNGELGEVCSVIGFVACDSDRQGEMPCGRAGAWGDLESLLMREVVDEVHIGLSARDCYGEIEETVAICQRVGIECKFSPEVFGEGTKAAIEWHGKLPVLTRRAVSIEGHQLLIKRALDIAVSLSALIFLAPVMVAIAAAILLTSEGPVLFVQERFGLHKRIFRMLKFRTMVVDAEARKASLEQLNEAQGPAFKIRHDPRITPLGRFLRKTSLDELPQLFNVLRGDMSLVGPRPLPRRDVARFAAAWLMRRFSVKPGLTCLWQISGRSNTSFDYWIAQDLEYIDRWSMKLDLEILMRTVPAVVRGSGAM